MAEYHVGCGAFGIYAGTLNSKNKSLWQNKSDVTDEAVSAVAQYLLQENKSLLFDYRGGRYRLSVNQEPPKEETWPMNSTGTATTTKNRVGPSRRKYGRTKQPPPTTNTC